MTISNELMQKNLGETLRDEFEFIAGDFYGGQFTKRLWDPGNVAVVDGVESIARVLDYCAFYKIPEITLTRSGGLSEEDINMAYYHATILVGVVGIRFDKSELETGQVVIHFSYNDDACSYYPINPSGYSPHVLAEIPYVHDWNSSAPRIDSIPYVGHEGELSVHNSDQLLYALVKGYTPLMVEDSPAKRVYNAAVAALKQVIYTDMTDYQKLLAIDTYLANTATYDTTSDDLASYRSADHANNHEEISSLCSGFFAEGIFFNHAGVCYGFAKAQAILAALLGLKVIPDHGPCGESAWDENAWKSTDSVTFLNQKKSYTAYNAHGVNIVEVNGVYGICDPTYRHSGIKQLSDGSFADFCVEPAVMLPFEKWDLKYHTANITARSMPPGYFVENLEWLLPNSDYKQNLFFKDPLGSSAGVSAVCVSYPQVETAVSCFAATVRAYKERAGKTEKQW